MRIHRLFPAHTSARLDDVGFGACLIALAVSLAVLTAATTLGDAPSSPIAAQTVGAASVVAVAPAAAPVAAGTGSGS